MRVWEAAMRMGGARLLAMGLGLVCLGGMGVRGAEADPKADVDKGKELFAREWMAGDPRSHGGDGLGPMYNDSSCVACHNLGGPGGGGPNGKNADIITAFANRVNRSVGQARPGFFQKAVSSLVGLEEPTTPPPPAKPRPPRTDELVKLHAGFRTARSLVLHRFGTDPNYEAWRTQMKGIDRFIGGTVTSTIGIASGGQQEMDRIKSTVQVSSTINQGQETQVGEFAVTRSQRNPTALFGAGLIDSIPDDVLVAASQARNAEYPEIQGRVSRQKGMKVGRFGWKGQTPSLDEFVRTACAVERGLESPGHHQAGLPQAPDQKAAGMDLTDDECASLVAYIRSLPAPAVREPSSPQESEVLTAGKTAFSNAGCAACHTPKLGGVEGIYSDLLLHDMGPELGDVGQYSVFDPNSTDSEIVDPAIETTQATPSHDETATVEAVTTAQPVQPQLPKFGATRQEWRTPPLWGFRDSGPYLHDGRAENLDQAVALHGGQGSSSARKYFSLAPRDRQQLQVFLKSLVAPTDLAKAEK